MEKLIKTFPLAPQSKFRKVRLSMYFYANGIWSERKRWDSLGLNVGEVFLVAGQSNASSIGDTERAPFVSDVKHRAVKTDDGKYGSWQPLQEPMANTRAGGSPFNGSPWGSFAQDLSAKLQGVPIALVNVSANGSALEFWASNATHTEPDSR